jgi:hypothetical protein
MNRVLLSKGGVKVRLGFLLMLRLQRGKKKIQPRQHIIGLARYLAACGDGTRRFTASIKRIFTLMVLGTVCGSKYPRPDVSPGAVVQRFLLYVPAMSAVWMRKHYTRPHLAPKDICVGICVKVRSNLGDDQKSSQSWKGDDTPNHKGREKSAPRD